MAAQPMTISSTGNTTVIPLAEMQLTDAGLMVNKTRSCTYHGCTYVLTAGWYHLI